VALWIWILSAALHPFGNAAARADAPVAQSLLPDMPRVADQAPSSLYCGQVLFFDSIEHRDMFEANDHRPLAMDSSMAPFRGRQGHRTRGYPVAGLLSMRLHD